MIDLNTGNEINNHKLDMENDKKLVDAYKEEKELLTSNEIKEIRNMYGMTQKEYAFALGMGEISIHRLEKTFIQSDETDSLMRLSGDPSIMLKLLNINKSRFEDDVYISQIKKKTLRSMNHKTYFGVGYLGGKNLTLHPLFYRWYNMLSRCYNIKSCNYRSYGAKGVTVSDELLCFKNFIDILSTKEKYKQLIDNPHPKCSNYILSLVMMMSSTTHLSIKFLNRISLVLSSLMSTNLFITSINYLYSLLSELVHLLFSVVTTSLFNYGK